MRFLHTADWHIGKKLHEFSLTDEQQDAFQQIEKIALANQVDAVVIAGDLYDRGQPSEQAVVQLNQMLKRLNLTDHLPILAISGNHDSAPRLATGSDWYQATDFYLHTTLASAFEPVEIGDTQFFLLPFFNLQEARNLFNQEVKNITQAMQLITARMKKQFVAAKAHVLVAHFFAAGSTHTDSEIKTEVGGLNAVPTDLLSDFDYVALGHLHNPQALNAARIRYSGSPLKFSVSEASLVKGVWIVDTAPFKLTWVPIKPLHDLVVLEGSFQELTTGSLADKYDQTTDYVAVKLTDTRLIDNLMERLREHYPRLIEIQRPRLQQAAETKIKQQSHTAPMDLLDDFYASLHDQQPLSDKQRQWARDALTAVEKGE